MNGSLVGLDMVSSRFIESGDGGVRVYKGIDWPAKITVVDAGAHSNIRVQVIDHRELPGDKDDSRYQGEWVPLPDAACHSKRVTISVA